MEKEALDMEKIKLFLEHISHAAFSETNTPGSYNLGTINMEAGDPTEEGLDWLSCFDILTPAWYDKSRTGST